MTKLGLASLWLACVIIGCALGAAVARSEPDSPGVAYAQTNWPWICSTLDETSGIDGMRTALLIVSADSGLSDFETGQAVGESVVTRCPRHLPSMRAFVIAARSVA